MSEQVKLCCLFFSTLKAAIHVLHCGECCYLVVTLLILKNKIKRTSVEGHIWKAKMAEDELKIG